MDKIYDESKMQMLIMGDFNIDCFKTSEPNTKKLLSFKNIYSLDQVINKPTRSMINKNSLLDLMFTNIRYITLTEVYNINMSDHLPTMIIYKKKREERNKFSIRCRIYSDSNIMKFKEELKKKDWSHLKGLDDVDEIGSRMYSSFLVLLDKCCPFKTITVKKDRPTYISDELIQMGKERDRLFKIACKSNTTEDWVIAREQRQRVNYAIRNAKRKYILENMYKCKGDSRKFWNNINILLPKKQSAEIKSVIDRVNNTELTGVEAGNFINKYFCEIGDKLVSKLPNKERQLFPPTETVKIKYIWNNPLTDNLVQEEVSKLDITKSSGFNEINTRCL